MTVENLGDHITNLLKERDLKLNDLGEYLDLNVRTLQRMLQSNSISKVDTLVKLCEFFSITPNQLLGIHGTDQDKVKIEDLESRLAELKRLADTQEKVIKLLEQNQKQQ